MMLHTVLGASGLIGSHLVKYLRASGKNVLAIGRNDAINWNDKLGHIYYCIGLTADFRQRTGDTVKAHVNILQEVLEKARFDSFLYLSSTRVYQDAISTGETTSLLVNPNRSDDLYNISKLMGESLCLSTPQANVRVARVSNVITSQKPNDTTNFFDVILDSILKRKYLILETDVTSEKDYIDLDDVVTLLGKIAQSGKERIYNVARGQNTNSAMLIDAIRQQVGFDFTVEVVPGSPVVKFPVINTQRLSSEFGFSPKTILDTVQSRVRNILV